MTNESGGSFWTSKKEMQCFITTLPYRYLHYHRFSAVTIPMCLNRSCWQVVGSVAFVYYIKSGKFVGYESWYAVNKDNCLLAYQCRCGASKRACEKYL